MKKFLLSVVAIFAISLCSFAQITVCDNPCEPATDGFSTGTVPYSPTTFPIMFVGQYVEQCITLQCPETALGANVDSIWFKNFIGVPDGLNFCISDTIINALEYCTVNFWGTPTLAGDFALKMRAHIYGSGFQLSIANMMVDTENGYSTGITLTVHEQGAVIASFSTDPEVTTSWTSSAVNITAGETVTFTSTCGETSHHIAWNFPGGNPESSTADEVTVTYMTDGNYVAELIAYSEDETSTDTATVNISVSAAPVVITVDFEADNTTVYTGQAVNFTNLTTATQAGNPYTGDLYYRWTFDADNGSLLSGSSDENPSYTYTTAGVYSVKLAVSTSQYGVYMATDTMLKTAYITVEDDPFAVIADFTSDPAASGMFTQSISIEQGQSVTYTSTSTGATSLAWTFEGGTPETSTDAEVTVTYGTTGTFTTTLIAYGEGDRQNTKSITVNVGEPTPVFNVDFVADVTTINVGETVNFTNNTTVTINGEPYTGDVYFKWNFNADNMLGGLTGDYTSTDINASYTYTTAGVYSVSLAASNSEISMLNSGTVETKDSYITVTDPVSVDENAINEISVYPNPTSSVINIAAENMQNITIIDMTGRVVMSKDVNSNFETISADGFAKANYMVRIATADGVVVRNIVVE